MGENKNKNMKIKFIEEEHKYIGEDDSEYLSVSALIHNLELKKDWDKIRKNYAKKNGGDRKSTRLNSSHIPLSRMPSSA